MNIAFLAGLIRVNNRVVVPNLGAFLRKEDGSIVFSPFLSKDDGMLVGAVSVKFRVSTGEASMYIDTFVDEVKRSLVSMGKFYIDSIGVLMLNENGGISLVEDKLLDSGRVESKVSDPVKDQSDIIPSIDPLLSRAKAQFSTPTNPVSEPQNTSIPPVIKSVNDQPVGAERPITGMPNQVASRPIVQSGSQPQRAINNVAQPIGRPVQPSWVPPMGSQSRPQPQPVQGAANNPQLQQNRTGIAGAVRPSEPIARPQSPTMQARPAPQGGAQPPQAARNTPVQPSGQQQRPMPRPSVAGKPSGHRPPVKGAPKKSSKPSNASKTDIWLLIAIVAAVLVVILIIYGLIYTDPMKQLF